MNEFLNRIKVSEATDVNKKSASKKNDIFHYWYFLNKGLKFQPNVCKRCPDLLMMSMNLSGIAILVKKKANYSCIISEISKKI